MITKNKEDLLVFGLTMVGLIATTAIVALIKSVKPSVASKQLRPLNKDYVHTERRCIDGECRWTVYYDDGDYDYEVTEHTLEAALKSMHELVNMQHVW